MKLKFLLIYLSLSVFLFNGCVKADTREIYEESQLFQAKENYYERMEVATNLKDNAKFLGCDDNHSVVKFANIEYQKAFDSYSYLDEAVLYIQENQSEINNRHQTEYPTAYKVWNYLKMCGFNDFVTAGIMGNIMTECGGHSLNLNPYAASSSYYGICQWSKKYCPDVWGKDLDYQLSYLKNTIIKEFDTFGKNYKKNFNFSQFIEMKDCEEAALAFAKCYERCNSKYYNVRKQDTKKAYNYFVTEAQIDLSCWNKFNKNKIEALLQY